MAPTRLRQETAGDTLRKGVDTSTGETEEHGRSEFIRATLAGDLLYAEALAEFQDIDVNVQDDRDPLDWCSRPHLPNLASAAKQIERR